MEPAPGPSGLGCPSGEVTGNTAGGDMNNTIMQNISNVHYGGVTGYIDLGLHPLICFPTGLEDEEYIGREKDVANLLKLVETNQHVLVRGCGGIGKTTLAIKCAETWTKAGRFQYAAFLLMDNEQTTKRSFITLTKECKLQLDYDFLPQLPSIYDKLNKYKILLVFDNIDDEMAIKPYLPSKNYHSNIFILGTSQHHMPHLFHVYKLSELPESAAVELVKGILNPPTDIPEDLLRELVRSLDCLALAVRQAAFSIHQDVEETGKEIVEVTETYMKESAARFNDQFPHDFINNYGKTVYAYLHHNISKCIKGDKSAGRLLHVLSYLNPTLIRKDMLNCVLGVAEEVVKKLIQRFVKYSIVAEEDGRCQGQYLSIHRTTQAVIRCAYTNDKGDILPCVFHMLLTCDDWSAYYHLSYVLPEMSESMLTEGYRKVFTSDTYKWGKKEELWKHNKGLVLEWEAPQFAAYLGHKEVLNRLSELSSPDTWVTENGCTWIHADVLGDQEYFLNKFMTDSSIIDTALHVAARKGCKGWITKLIKRGVNLNIRDVRGDSALYVALSRGHLGSALQLLEVGSKINPNLCSEITANYSVTEELKFPSSIAGGKNVQKIHMQYLYMAADVVIEGVRPKKLFKLSKFINNPYNSELFQEIQDESGEEFAAVLKAVDGIWEAAVVASRYIRQHQLTVGQLVEDISGEGHIPGVWVVYPPEARCSKALAFAKLLLKKIKNISSDALNIATLFVALPRYLTERQASDYLDLSSEKARGAIEVLEAYGILHIKGNKIKIKDVMRPLTHVYMRLEKLPQDTCFSLFEAALLSSSFDKTFARQVLEQMTLQQLTSVYERTLRVHSPWEWTEVLEGLQKAGCEIESATDVTWSPLHYAVVFDNSPEHVIERLLELGTEVDVRGPRDLTPLHMAALRGRYSHRVLQLIKKGAQVNAVTFEGLTPLHMAAYSDWNVYCNNELINELKAGADPQIKDKKGHTMKEAGPQIKNTSTRTCSIFLQSEKYVV